MRWPRRSGDGHRDHDPRATAGRRTRAAAADVRVDPRIAQRRAAVAGVRRRRRLRRGALVVGVVVVLAGGWYVTRTPLLAVHEVAVQGGARTPEADIVEASGVSHGDPLVDLDVSGQAAAVAALPWVEDAEIDVGWLERSVTIRVRERQAAASVAVDDERALLVDADGWALEEVPVSSGRADALPVVRGATAVAPGARLDDAARGALSVALDLSPGVASRVAHVELGSGGGVELALRPRGRAVLGDADSFETQRRTLQTVLATVDLECLETLDVQLADTAVLTREESCG